ncbi:hypothetical protein LguiB_018095 [Lonicera macranthoides]
MKLFLWLRYGRAHRTHLGLSSISDIANSWLLSAGVESDCKEVIDLCSNKKDPPSDIVSIIADIRCLASNWSGVLERGSGVCLVDGQYLAECRSSQQTPIRGAEEFGRSISSLIVGMGELPIGIGNLSGLTTLLLDSNKLTGFILSTLGRLENLAQLYLEHNDLK